MNNLKLRAIFLFTLVILLLTGCKREFDWLGGPGEIISTGKIEVPDQVDQRGWKIISGLNEGIISKNNFKLKLNENVVQLISVLNANDQPVLLAIDITHSQPSENIINAESTAEALVFLYPFFCTSDLTEAADLKEMINSAESFDFLVNMLNSHFNNPSFALSETDSELIAAVQNVINEIISKVENESDGDNKGFKNKGFFPIPDTEVNGLSIIELEQQNSGINFRIANRAKRWVSIYVDKSENGTSFTRSDKYVDMIPSPKLSIFNIWKMKSINFLPPVKSEQINISTAGFKAFKVRCYGLGVHNLFEDPDEVEISRTIEPAIYSAVLDIGIPIFEVCSGTKISCEIRGRAATDPLMMLLKKTFEDYRNDAIIIGKTLVWFREGDVGKILGEVTKFMLTSCINNPSLVTQIIFNTLEKNVARTTINTVFLVFRIGNAVFKSVNIAYSIASIVSTEAVTDYVLVNSLAPMDVILKGTVKSYKTSIPISGASVSFYDKFGNLNQITQTDASGSYTLGANTGDCKIRVVASGYKPSNHSLHIPEDIVNQNPPNYYAPVTWLSTYSGETGDIDGIVVDATNLHPVTEVSIELKPGINEISREITQKVVSGADGSFHFSSIPSGTYTAFFSKAGYINDFLIISVLGGETTSGFIMNLSPDIHTTSGYRIVLTWGQNPRDLDSHLFTPPIEGTRYHIYFSNKGSLSRPPYVNLDVDDVSSYGPETITIGNTVPGEYFYSVYHYSGSGTLATTSGATISLYGVNGFIRSWNVPSTGDGKWWNVFSINGETGKITNINEISNNPPIEYKGMAEMDMKNKK